MDDLKPFVTDGCSGGMSWFWKHVLHKKLPWERACVVHDKRYWIGGTREMRRKADCELMGHVAISGHPVWAVLMYIAVRIGGSPWLPFPWRWGFGWKYGRGYRR